MNISVSKEQGNVVILQLAGQLDGQSYQDLIMKAQEVIGDGTKNILLDMGELTYISSAGLVSLHTISMLLRGEKTPDPEQGWSTLKSMDRTRDGGLQKNLKLLNPHPQVVSVLDMVGFTEFFEIFTDRQKAIDSF
jgi:anti-anti-sigma regulatory factor